MNENLKTYSLMQETKINKNKNHRSKLLGKKNRFRKKHRNPY